MQDSFSKEAIGCIGKCTTGLTNEQLDQITTSITGTLKHTRGREIFRRYLEKRKQRINIECLDLYEACCDFLKQSQDESLFMRIKETVEDLDGVSQIDFALLERFSEISNNNPVSDKVSVIEETMDRLCDHLQHVHNDFKNYVSKPCPLTK